MSERQFQRIERVPRVFGAATYVVPGGGSVHSGWNGEGRQRST
jgi:hypothetical protein